MAFTPWTTLASYIDLVNVVDDVASPASVAPVRWAIRLLVTFESALLELPDIQRLVGPFDPTTLTYPWVHPDPRVDSCNGR